MTLKIKNLSKRYDENRVIREVSFEVADGEILGIFGAVGVGKSTLIRAIAGAENHDGGAVFSGSEDLSALSCLERAFNFPNLSNEHFWKLIFKTNKPSELADGEAQALALDVALKNSGNVLLLDNQFCFMDRRLKEKKAEQLKKTVKEKNLSVVFATNDFEEIFTICDRVAILSDGKIIQSGTPREVYEHPNCVESARVTGRNNIIAARSRRLASNKSDIPEFVTVDGEHRVFTNKVSENNNDLNNQDVDLAIRPEHISISFGASFPEDNLLKAEITEINYLGATTLIKLNAGGLLLKAMVLRLVGLNVGDECMVGLPPDRILVFFNSP